MLLSFRICFTDSS